MGETEEDNVAKLFENFVQASSCKGALQAFNVMCRKLDLEPSESGTFYDELKAKVTCWKAKALWAKLDKRMSHKEYKKGHAAVGTRCLIIGGGPCGLRTAIELALMGAKVVVIEKRDSFSRHNVLHLWPFTIHDLRGLGAKKFCGKFCAGAIDHISIQQLQLILLKVALLVAVEFHINTEFVKLLEPPEDQENKAMGWRAAIRPADHPVANFDFDVIVGADGRRNTLDGFKRKEFRGKLAIAITANFLNRNTTAEAKVEEISGVAFIFNQKFFLDLKEETGIDLENIVYYKDNTHYFVMTAKKQSLMDKGVVMNDYIDTQMLLSSENVNQEALLCYAREAADFGTNYQLPTLDFASNHCGQPDVAMFDFTSMYASENAALVRERFGHQLLVALVGDSLLEPFWPMGTGCARGFLAAFDLAWMVKSWAEGRPVLEVLAERESVYRLLHQTTPENITKNFDQYTVDPGTRYPNLNVSSVRPHQVRQLYISGELKSCSLERAVTIRRPVNLCRRESEIRPARLLTWCQRQTEGYRGVDITDLSSSWLSGTAFCALIHRFKPQLVDFDSLNEEDQEAKLQLAFDISEREFGIRPFTTGKELCADQELDKTKMITYLSKFYELFRGTPLPASGPKGVDENSGGFPSKEVRSNNNVLNLALTRKRVPKDEKKTDSADNIYKRRRKFGYLEEATNLSSNRSAAPDDAGPKENKVRSMASQLLAKFENKPNSTIRRQIKAHTQQTREFHTKSIKEKAVHITGLFSSEGPASPKGGIRRTVPQSADRCRSCDRRVYLVERVSAEGLFFHRECFRCSSCNSTLRLGAHAFDTEQGKLYCQLHFDQRSNGTHLRRTFSQRSIHNGGEAVESCVFQEQTRAPVAPHSPSSGTWCSWAQKQLRWPLSVTRAVCNAPQYLSNCVRSTTHALTTHLTQNVQEYAFLFELMTIGVPLLLVLQEVLLQMYTEAVPEELNTIQTVVQWLQQQL
ncbi:F-actin-monooxygenase mical2b isoform X5 [Eucyclogobius newberryi]|uniref:F-actin-monooxygenase mical2b isoform X5 n=1 Tax=Eucyclogobius newberryi TaxID=166745 RepID=UPI003B5BF9B7